MSKGQGAEHRSQSMTNQLESNTWNMSRRCRSVQAETGHAGLCPTGKGRERRLEGWEPEVKPSPAWIQKVMETVKCGDGVQSRQNPSRTQANSAVENRKTGKLPTEAPGWASIKVRGAGTSHEPRAASHFLSVITQMLP